MDIRVTVEVLVDSEWDHKRKRYNDSWVINGKVVRHDVDPFDLVKSLERAKDNCGARLGVSSNEYAFLQMLIDQFRS